MHQIFMKVKIKKLKNVKKNNNDIFNTNEINNIENNNEINDIDIIEFGNLKEQIFINKEKIKS